MPRRPTPTHLKLVTGNPGKRKLNPRDVSRAQRPTRSVPMAPPHLSLRAQDAWARMLKILTGIGVVEAADAFALERLCECYAEVCEMRECLDRRGASVYETTTVAGGRMVRAYPEVAMLADADRRLKGYLTEFGLTPATRSKVGGSELLDNGGKGPIEDYFA